MLVKQSCVWFNFRKNPNAGEKMLAPLVGVNDGGAHFSRKRYVGRELHQAFAKRLLRVSLCLWNVVQKAKFLDCSDYREAKSDETKKRNASFENLRAAESTRRKSSRLVPNTYKYQSFSERSFRGDEVEMCSILAKKMEGLICVVKTHACTSQYSTYFIILPARYLGNNK